MKPLFCIAAVCATALSITMATNAAYGADARNTSAPGPAAHGHVVPPPRPAVVTEVVPGMPEADKRNAEREHGMAPNFRAGKYRLSNGNYERD
ncbi:Lipoprotein [Paraburkholderia kururiensis]|uniref:hypothetical protein n=1 Tax=Paraburkholderia kururiensis TaxID=984307 RepID=UPI0039A63C6E